MIDEIFQEYKKQENDNIILMTKHFGIDVKCLLYPNINNDLVVILDRVNLLNDEIDSFKRSCIKSLQKRALAILCDERCRKQAHDHDGNPQHARRHRLRQPPDHDARRPHHPGYQGRRKEEPDR